VEVVVVVVVADPPVMVVVVVQRKASCMGIKSDDLTQQTIG